ncbi:unnamed protein product [Hyaloperonospora brassicae]|uniref:Uncharacterized protein n=1 Tax=Hyaloperonospora brassicae TaxID=162125 RepID=A0AAV0TD30_HYABA|nr:unnamed protein product [Hyaloperonospora brassicae]
MTGSSSFPTALSAAPTPAPPPPPPLPTTTTSPPDTVAPRGSSSSSPDSSVDGHDARRSASSASNSPMRRLPPVLRAPSLAASAANECPPTTSSATSDSAPTVTRSLGQTSPSQAQGPPSQSALAPSSLSLSAPTSVVSASAGRVLPGVTRRHLYPASSLSSPYSGNGNAPAAAVASPSTPLPLPYFGASEDAGRGTTRVTSSSSSYNHHNRLSPVSSPAMTGESWVQNAPASTSVATRGLKRHLPQQQQQYSSPLRNGYESANKIGGGGPSVRMLPLQQKAASAAGTTSTTMSRRASSSLSGTGIPVKSSIASAGAGGSSSSATASRLRSSHAPKSYGDPPSEDPMQYEPLGEARHPRNSTRYETWTSKQLRKKCSHLKLRGLKNVKKHVMVEALYRYYRNQRLKDMANAASIDKTVGSTSSAALQHKQTMSPQQHPQRMEGRRPSSNGASSMSGSRSDTPYRSRYEQRSAGPTSQSQYGSSRSRSYVNYGSQSPSPPSSGGDSGGPRSQRDDSLTTSRQYLDEEFKGDPHPKEVPVTSEDVIRLVDVVLSPDFVDRLAAELSRWQFWVDIREMYIALLSRQHPPGSAGSRAERNSVGTGGSATNSRNFKWSSMQLWEIWKELTFAYTKTCFEFTTAGVDDREYINFCDGRPDVYYLHQRLHARPDLLHLIKSNEYIDENCTTEASESIAHEQQQAHQNQETGPLIGSGTPMLRNHKRYKRSVPTGPTSDAYNSARAIAAFRDGTAGADGTGGAVSRENSGDNGCGQGSGDLRGHSPEENSTENSETTGEEGSSSNTANSNASNSSMDTSMRAALAEQKYFGLLLQNFEVIFESLHNKKVLLATLRKDSKAPDQLIADLHDDIHVLSALKKEFRNKLRRTIQ